LTFQALHHNVIFVIHTFTTTVFAEEILRILVFVIPHPSFGFGLIGRLEFATGQRQFARGAIATKIAFVKNFNNLMLRMAMQGACITNTRLKENKRYNLNYLMWI
jgi:hypothetical protein